ncbi:MAG: hypothetical protein COB33_005950 [Thiotrichaceae bacterium]|nr:hypothetical protein [Thiotrichaceae bacterium]PCI13487.1 MAG: hypothetical protein COB71_05875 [Thiotrichales bacterium]
MSDSMKQILGLGVGLVCWFLFLMLLFNEATTAYALVFLFMGILLKGLGSVIRLPGNALLSGAALVLILPFGEERE